MKGFGSLDRESLSVVFETFEILAGREPGGRADLSCRGNAAGGSGMFVRGEHGGERGKRGNEKKKKS